MPNTFAFVMLLVWPLVSAYLFRRLTLGQAVIWTILGGYLLLPPTTSIALPLLPDLDKVTIPNLCAFVGFVRARPNDPGLPKSIFIRTAFALFILTPIGTVLTNADFIRFGAGGLPPMTLTELPSTILTHMIIALPAILGYKLLRDEQTIRDFLVALVVAGMVYSVPMLVEVRLSPQINVWVYGFFQHAFDQTMRYGGFRPVVFLPHGLWVAFFAFMTAIAAVTLLRNDVQGKRKNFFIVLYLIVVLFLCKSANAITYIVLFVPLVLFTTSKMQIRLAAVVAPVVLLYPVLRGADLIPTDAIADLAAAFDTDRAGSLIFRLVNEDVLLKHAAERPWFGWGGWGRNWVHDTATGHPITIIDGQWIITIGTFGWFGYLGEFGLLTLPLLILAIRTTNVTQVSRYGAALALIQTANLIDLIPNATLVPLTWLMAGALLGYADAIKVVVAGQPEIASPGQKSAPWARPATQSRDQAIGRP